MTIVVLVVYVAVQRHEIQPPLDARTGIVDGRPADAAGSVGLFREPAAG
ncbi:hypothetical protein [uncultured Friedmanniella sp.]